MNPFMTSFKNNYISAARSGGSGYILLCALVALAQDPGSDNMRFSVTVFMSIFGILLCLPILGYIYITRYKIGLREQVKKIYELELSHVSDPIKNQEEQHNPMNSYDSCQEGVPDRLDGLPFSKVDRNSPSSQTSHDEEQKTWKRDEAFNQKPSNRNIVDQYLDYLVIFQFDIFNYHYINPDGLLHLLSCIRPNPSVDALAEEDDPIHDDRCMG